MAGSAADSIVQGYGPFGRLGYEIKRDVHRKDLDAKILITSHNSRPGLGKTTLAIWLARELDPHGWDANSKAFMTAQNYHNAYEEAKPGSVLLFDEIEGEADSRRSTSNKNVDLSQAWAQNRYRNMITICTLPSVSMLDKRLEEMSDYWINVMDRGRAHPYKILVNDYTGKVYRHRMGAEGNAEIFFSDLPKGDEDYEVLKEQKHERRMHSFEKYYTEAEYQAELEKKLKEQWRERRNELLFELHENTDMSISEISQLSFVDVSRQRVNQILLEV